MNIEKEFLAFLSEVKNEVELHEFVPANALSVTNARLDLGQFWPKVEDILKSVSPALHLLLVRKYRLLRIKLKFLSAKICLGLWEING